MLACWSDAVLRCLQCIYTVVAKLGLHNYCEKICIAIIILSGFIMVRFVCRFKKCVYVLLQAGASTNAVTADGWTPAHFACETGQVQKKSGLFIR